MSWLNRQSVFTSSHLLPSHFTDTINDSSSSTDLMPIEETIPGLGVPSDDTAVGVKRQVIKVIMGLRMNVLII